MARAFESAYRVYYFARSHINGWRKARDKQGATNLAFLTEAIDKHLPRVVTELRAVGMCGRAEERQAVRLEVPMTVLRELTAAREATGVSSTACDLC